MIIIDDQFMGFININPQNMGGSQSMNEEKLGEFSGAQRDVTN